MNADVAVAAALLAGVLVYAVFGGADFGSGWFDLTAGGAGRGASMRRQIDHSIGPVWEANHVWLIYVLVMGWTGFPEAFAAVMTTLALPLLGALLGIVLRGSTFAFRKYAESIGQARVFGVVFALSSVLTPFFLGTVAGAIASGRVPAEGHGDPWASWTTPTSMLAGVVAVASCAFLAGTFLASDAARARRDVLAETLRRRTLRIGAVTGALVLGGLWVIRSDAPTLWHGLVYPALPMVVCSALGGVAALALLSAKRPAPARLAAVIAVASVVAGWGVAQYPWLLVDEVTIADAAGAPATMQGLLVVVGVAVVLVGPAMLYLFRLTQSESWTS